MVQMPLRSRLLLTTSLLAVLAPAPASARRTPPPTLQQLRCVPIDAPRCASGPAVPVGLQLLLRGRPFYNGMRVTFRWSATRAVATTLRRTHVGWVARVPARAHIGMASPAATTAGMAVRAGSRRAARLPGRAARGGAPDPAAPPRRGGGPAPPRRGGGGGGGGWPAGLF